MNRKRTRIKRIIMLLILLAAACAAIYCGFMVYAMHVLRGGAGAGMHSAEGKTQESGTDGAAETSGIADGSMKNGGLWQELEVRITAERLRAKGYPDDLVEFYEHHPETREYVVDYFEKKDNHPGYDISGEVTKGEVPLLLQWDERWGYEMYSDEMMGLSGCGPTSLAMAGLGLTGDAETFDPLAVARFAVRQGYYEDGVGTSWLLFSEGAEMLGLRVHKVAPVEDALRDFLDSGNPVICSVGPGDFTEAGHFIVLTAIDADGYVTVRDPVSPARSKITWPVGRILGQVRNLWGYSVED